MEYTEEQGIEAIIFLQGMDGVKETKENATKTWREMDAKHKERTMIFYEAFKDTDATIVGETKDGYPIIVVTKKDSCSHCDCGCDHTNSISG